MLISSQALPSISSRRKYRTTINPRDTQLEWESIAWFDKMILAGGRENSNILGTPNNSLVIADGLVKALKRTSFFSKIVLLYPWLGGQGGGAQAARVPLIDKLNVGLGTITFSDSSFAQNTGVQGNGGVYLDTGLKPSQLGTSMNGGLGHWETNFVSDGGAIGCYDGSASTVRMVIDLRTTTEIFWWNWPGNAAAISSGTASGNHHYYGQRSSNAQRDLFRNGSMVATNVFADTTADSTTGERNILILANNYSSIYYHTGRSGVSYLTSGDLTGDEPTILHNVLRDYLMIPTGRI